jgi:hypothetical protein
VSDRELEADVGRLDERVLALSARADDLRDEMRLGFTDVRADIRALRARLDTLLLATVAGLIGVIATLALKL